MTSKPPPASNDRARRFFRPSLTPWMVLAYDTLAGAAAMYASIGVRYLFEPEGVPPGPVEWYASGVFALVSLVVLAGLGVNRAMWRYTAVNDVVRVLQAVLLAHLIFLPVLFLTTRLDDFPRSSLLGSVPLMVFALVVPRMAATAWRTGDLKSLFRFERRSGSAAVLIGETTACAEVLQTQLRREGGPLFRFQAVIDTKGKATGRHLQGVPVTGGPDQLEATVRMVKGRQSGVRLVLADADPAPDLVNLCARVAGSTGASLTRARRGEGANAFTQVEAGDLLSRTPRRLATAGARALVSGKRVLVTGAGGTIGGEVVRQIARCAPAELILVDSAESHLYQIDLDLRRETSDLSWQSLLCDVREEGRVRALFDEVRPEIVLHAAALKHVPLSETNAAEAARTNVLGTIAVTEAAISSGAEALVMISTDKAVDPSSVMGATKRCAEIYLAARAGQKPATRLSSVRFGNVLASTGSVVPLFERQIETGGPVTVTHPDMTRYFMTVEEAASLVLEAGAQSAEGLAPQGSLFVLDMGEPVPIARMARQLIRLRGKEPGRDIAIEYIGLRPGEKLHEALAHPFEPLAASSTPGVLRTPGPRIEFDVLAAAIERLRAAAEGREASKVLAALDEIVALGVPEGVISLSGRLSAGE